MLEWNLLLTTIIKLSTRTNIRCTYRLDQSQIWNDFSYLKSLILSEFRQCRLQSWLYSPPAFIGYTWTNSLHWDQLLIRSYLIRTFIYFATLCLRSGVRQRYKRATVDQRLLQVDLRYTKHVLNNFYSGEFYFITIRCGYLEVLF